MAGWLPGSSATARAATCRRERIPRPRGGFGRELRWRRLWQSSSMPGDADPDRSAIRCGVGTGRRMHVGPRDARRKIPGGNGITSDILAVVGRW